MANLVKTKLNDGSSLSAVTGYDSPGVYDASDTVKLGPNFTGTSSIFVGTPPTGGGGALWLSGEASFNLTGSNQLNYTGLYASAAPAYSVSIAAGTSLNVQNNLALLSTSGVSNHKVFVGAGGSFTCGWFFTSTGGTVSITKEGGGDFQIGNATTGNTNIITLTMVGGKIRYGGTTGTLANSLVFNGGGIEFYGNATGKTVTQNVTVNSDGGTISGLSTTWSGTTSGTGTLTIDSAVTWNNTIACSLNIASGRTLSLGSTYNLTGATLTGSGTINTAGSYTSTISNNAPDFTGSVSGSFNYSGTNKTFGGQITGNVKVPANQSVTFSRTDTHSGFLSEILNGASAVVKGRFTGVGDGYTDVYYNGTINFDGASADITSAQTSIWDLSTLKATGGTNCSGLLDITWDNSGANKGAVTILSDDTNTNRWSGNWVCGGDAATRGSIQVRVKNDGVFEFAGTASSQNASHTRPFNINGASGYAGTVRLTGGGFNTPSAPINHLSGTLQINRVGAVQLGAGLTVSANATLHCATPNAAYTAQLTGNVTLQANSIMKFAA